MEAARLTANAERADKVSTNFQLLMTLVEQNHGGAILHSEGEQADPSDQKILARQTISRVAPRLNRSTAWTAAALEALSEVMTDTGMGAGRTGRIPRLMHMLRRTRTTISEWGQAQRQEDHMAYARMICGVADLTISMSDNVLAQVHAMTGEMVGLLRAWSVDPESVVRLSSRPEWLLDGWEKICLIWDYAQDQASRRAAVVEIVDLVPILPREARDWCDTVFEIDDVMRRRRNIRLNEDWRTGETVVDLIARNEHFRAAAC